MGQGIFAQGFVRPSVPGVKLPADVADKLPPAPQVHPLDVQKAAAKKAEIDAGWAKAAITALRNRAMRRGLFFVWRPPAPRCSSSSF